MTFWEKQSYGDRKKISIFQGFRGEWENDKTEHRGSLRQWNYLFCILL